MQQRRASAPQHAGPAMCRADAKLGQPLVHGRARHLHASAHGRARRLHAPAQSCEPNPNASAHANARGCQAQANGGAGAQPGLAAAITRGCPALLGRCTETASERLHARARHAVRGCGVHSAASTSKHRIARAGDTGVGTPAWIAVAACAATRCAAVHLCAAVSVGKQGS
jgi:hypothetical protein